MGVPPAIENPPIIANSQQNAITTFETAYGTVSLSPEVVSNYLKRGNKNLTEAEIALFINLCKYQKLNPFVGEAYPIKFGEEFQMVIGYDTYKRRAEENPAYRGRKSGIVVLRGDQVVQKEGACVYPSEKLIGGWCRVYRELHGSIVEDFKEVGLEEYNKKQANWNTKPATMIEKVAVSQALRSAFPKDYAGLYTAEELPAPENTGGQQPPPGSPQADGIDPETGEILPKVTNEQRKNLFDQAKQIYGDDYVAHVQKMVNDQGFKMTSDLTVQAYEKIMQAMSDEYAKKLDAMAVDGNVQ